MRLIKISLAIFLSTAATADEVPDFLGTKETPTTQVSTIPGGLQFLAALDNPPFSFLDDLSRLNGFSVYLAKAVCEELNYTNNCIIAGRLSSDLDLVSSTDTASIIISSNRLPNEAEPNYRFTKPFLRIPARFAARKEIANQLDLTKNSPDTKIGVVAKSVYERMLRSYFPETSAVGYVNNALLLKDLSDGKIDLAFGGGIELAAWLASGDSNGCCAFADGPYYSNHFLGEGVRFAVPASRGALVKQLDSALVSLQQKGRIEELFLRFFPVNFY
jgi:polar amino acid transport system substrate-binding protein